MATENQKIKDTLIEKIAEQFSEYDHHNQKLFVQFFSAVLVVLIGYAFVFSNQKFLYPPTAVSNGSYTLMHLLAVYVVAQIILIFLSTLILNIGYCFRRDQLIVYNIRKNVFSEEEYSKLFGARANNPLNKGFLKDSYLPTFNALFYRFIILVQTTLFIAMVIAQEASSPELLAFVHNHRITYIYIIAFPLLINLSEYVRYYIKYKTKVDINPYDFGKINNKLSLIQEGWATFVPLLLLFELLLHGTWKMILTVFTEVSSWALLLAFLYYLYKVLKLDKKNNLPAKR